MRFEPQRESLRNQVDRQTFVDEQSDQSSPAALAQRRTATMPSSGMVG